MKNKIITLGIYTVNPMFNMVGWQTRQLVIEKDINLADTKKKVLDFATKHELEPMIVWEPT